MPNSILEPEVKDTSESEVKDTPVAKLAKIVDKHREHEAFMRDLLSPDADIHAVKKMVGDLSRLSQRDLKRLEKLLTL